MPIIRVELNADRLRHRRDNRQLRASNREARYVDGDTLANSAADTPTTRAPQAVPLAANDDPQAQPATARERVVNPIAKDALQRVSSDGRLCDLKAVFSGASTPAESLLPVCAPGAISTDLPMQVGQAMHAQLAPDTPIRRATGDQRRAPLSPTEIHLPVLSDPVALDPRVGQSRLDLITGEWTWFATMRSQRPDQFGNVVVEPATDIDCPFCTGQEHRTPDPVWSARIDGANGHTGGQASNNGQAQQPADWSVRVVPNLYPAVTPLKDVIALAPASQNASEQVAAQSPTAARWDRSGGAFPSGPQAYAYRDQRPMQRNARIESLFPCEIATGGHEVIIEAPRHTESFGDLNTAEISLVFAAYAQRIRYWRNVPGIKHVTIFKNVGRDAGASLQHSHSQLIATNRVPTMVQQVTRRLQTHHARVGSCLQCDLLRGELDEETRIVSQTDSFVAYCPFASRFPMQVRLTSKEHLPCFSELRSHPLDELARLALRVVRWLEVLRPSTAYNVLLHTCPVNFTGAPESQHWAMDIFPRVSRLAGFELATGAMINPIYPETAAKAYREQARLGDPRYVLR